MRPPGLDEAGGAVEHRRLLLAADLEAAGAQAPLGVRVAPPGAAAGAGRVDERRRRSARRDPVTASARAARRADLDVAGARAGEAVVDRREAARVAVGGVDLAVVLHQGGERQRLAAAAGAEIDDLLARLARRTGARRAASPRPGSRSSPCRNSGSAWTAGPRPSSAGGTRRPRGECGVSTAARCASASCASSREAALRRVDAQVERRPGRERLQLRHEVVAEGCAERGLDPVRESRPRPAPARPSRRRRREPLALAAASAARARSARPSTGRAIASASSPRCRRSAPRSTARGVASPISQAAEALAGAGRRRRGSRSRRGPSSRRSGAKGPNP